MHHATAYLNRTKFSRLVGFCFRLLACPESMYRDRNLLAGFLNIFYEFNPSTLIWTDLSENCAGDAVPARTKMGFTTMNERLVIFGGSNSTSTCTILL